MSFPGSVLPPHPRSHTLSAPGWLVSGVPIGRLVGWLARWMSMADWWLVRCQWLVGWLVRCWWLNGWLVGWLAGYLVVCLFGWLVGWLVGSLFVCLVGWLHGWLVGWLVGWGCRLLIRWLAGYQFIVDWLVLGSIGWLGAEGWFVGWLGISILLIGWY